MSKGLASVKTLTAQEIAKKWNLPLATVAKKIAAGVKVEKEHTKSTRQSNEIARDHLGERPDYYDKLDKMEKTKIVKEESTTGGIAGLGVTTGTPAIAPDNEYIDTNSMSYEDWNGAILKMIKDRHNKHLIDMGFTSYSPNDIQGNANRVVKEGVLNELGDYVKDGMPGYEGTSGPIRAVRKDAVKNPINERGKVPADMSGGAERGIYENIKFSTSHKVVHRDSKKIVAQGTKKEMMKHMKALNAKNPGSHFVGNAPSKKIGDVFSEGHIGFGHPYDWAGDRVKRKVYGTKPKEKPESNEPGTGDTYKGSKQGGKVKLAKTVKPVNEISDELVGRASNATFWKKKVPSERLSRYIKKAHLRDPKEKKEQPKTVKEETKMDTKELINEALDNILEDNLSEMKDNLMLALQEKAMEKLEERKKEIAAQYFAQ